MLKPLLFNVGMTFCFCQPGRRRRHYLWWLTIIILSVFIRMDVWSLIHLVTLNFALHSVIRLTQKYSIYLLMNSQRWLTKSWAKLLFQVKDEIGGWNQWMKSVDEMECETHRRTSSDISRKLSQRRQICKSVSLFTVNLTIHHTVE